MPVSEGLDKTRFQKRDFFISLGIYGFFFYSAVLILSFILFSLFQRLGELSRLPIGVPLIYLFIILSIGANIAPLPSVMMGKRKAKRDLTTPINDSDSDLNKAHEWLNNFDLQHPYLRINFFKRNSQITSAYGSLYGAYLIGRDWLASCDNPELVSSENYDAIIVLVYNRISSSAMMGCGIELLIKLFQHNNHPYKIYLCNTRKEFLSILNNPKATRIWIFGHGSRGGVSCSDGFCLYTDFIDKMTVDAKKKEAVYQFHCNPGILPSLVELLSVKKGFVNHSINDPSAIREYLKNIIRNNRFEELIMLN